MGAPRFVPSDSILKRWRVDEGLTVDEIIARIKEQDGVEVAPGTIYAALSRAGLTKRIRYDEHIPWQVRSDHVGAYPLVMLRLAARRDAGETIPADKAKKLDAWIARMQEDGVVVHYSANTAEGWFYVPARPGIDTGLIRVPD